jgi:hypothetical protein
MDDIEGRTKDVPNVYHDKERFFTAGIFKPLS